jgi:succinate dehydrogenase/fumarate reductase flavoprotein subunit
MSAQELSRRSFVTAAAGASATALAAVAAGTSTAVAEDASSARWSWETEPDPIPADQIKETVECDVVVVGAGISGLPAAMKAAELGADVHVVEKRATYGTHRSGFAAFNTKAQAELGVSFSQEDRDRMLLDVYQTSGRHQVRLPLWSRFMDESGEMADWLYDIMDAKGVKMNAGGIGFSGDTSIVAGDPLSVTNYFTSYDLSHSFSKTGEVGEDLDWTGIEVEYAEECGAVFHYSQQAVRLVREEGGRVASVIAYDLDKEDGYVEYVARKGIILAAGDFVNDREMMERYCPLGLKTYYNYGEPTCTGDLHKAGMWIGVVMEDEAVADAWAGQTTTGKNLHPTDDPLYAPYTIWAWQPAISASPMLYVDKYGSRFTNEETESGVGSTRMAACLATVPADGFAWSIWDGAWADKFPSLPGAFSPFTVNTQEQMDIDVDEGCTLKADTIEELVELMGVDPDTFAATLERYNALCDKGHDDDCCKGAQWMQPIDTPPFYAASIGMAIDCVRGGLLVNTDMQCVDADGWPIEGLYAADNTAGGWYGSIYTAMMGASGTGHGMFGGWLAAKILCE